ncbi:cellulase-domain-containing protein [Aspergillus uvarum CBS 121591]|uniref:Endoglucanase EG-II n=1 Tax=Aspergillus uvarum CBS 121591 TaxID=1448315 RepID=A0A319BZ63_9EURO|nr:cellulase-domain-containing protein [Aspergillus uvarum CBS 121591]PYH79016.1 cellulase-domain-containing protein [Aspergillus uvarum CBS 121591]
MLVKPLAITILTQVAKANVWLAGVNIAGFDFGCGNTNGVYTASEVMPPLLSQGGADGAGQMSHFTNTYGLNVYRLPVCWQYLVNNNLGGSLDATNFGIYNELVQACLDTGAYCVIDIHNYARWNNQIVGQSSGAVTSDQLASVWWQLAANYASKSKLIFGVMNEPHDLDVISWATSVQEAVTSIRNASATSQIILLPGTSYTSVGGFISDGSASALSAVKNPDGSTTNLIFDVHQYLDSDGSGTSTTCTTNGVSNLGTLATWLRSNGRQAFLTETGGGSTSSCYTDLCAELDWMNDNSDVFLGWIGWAAGSFATSYALSLTPTYADGVWTDTGILSSCVAGKF